jgi:hypothetical protein
MKFLVCDDLSCDDTINAINEGTGYAHQIDSACSRELKEKLEYFFEAIEGFLDAIKKSSHASPPNQFDGYDIVFLDNNLSHLGIKGARLTAETIVGYIRAYSNANYIVSLNKNLEVDFDLRYLVGDYSTVSDLALNTHHLGNGALWTGDPSDTSNGFRPWYWPALLAEPERRSEQIEFVRNNIDNPVFEALGIPGEMARYISRHAIGALSPLALYDAEDDNDFVIEDDIRTVTFIQSFIARNRSISDKIERKNLTEMLNTKSQEGEFIREMISRSVAADIDLWLRRDLIAPQDVLVDLPHLLVRMPFLIDLSSANLVDWNDAILNNHAPFGMEESIFDNYLAHNRFIQDIWVKSPTFFWQLLKSDDGLNDLYFSSNVDKWIDAAFCEDLSVFVDRGEQDEGSPAEFEAEFEGSWRRRYVRKIEDLRYVPRSRFAI